MQEQATSRGCPFKINRSKYARLAFQRQDCLAFMILARVVLIGLLLGQFAFPPRLVQAQSTIPGKTDPNLVIYPAQIEDFPTVKVGFELYDVGGNFVEGLDAAKVTILEDERAVPVQSIKMIQPGLQMAVAVNAGPALGMLVGKESFFERVMQPLVLWAESRAGANTLSGSDEFSFSTNTGMDANRLKQPAEWLEAIKRYKPDLEKSQPNLVSLTQALDQATESTASARIRRTILFITPALPRTAATNLANLVNRARQVGVRVHVWLVSPTPTPEADSAASLRVLAEQTGGKFALVTSASNPPDLESWLAPQRFMYEAAYISAARESGNHKVSVQVDWKGKKVNSRENSYSLALQAPNPIFLSPPSQVKRMFIEAKSDGIPKVEVVPLSILVEFPDGIQRPLKATRLYVDGVLTAENTRETFNQFLWSPSSQVSTRRQTLRVEVEDVLGLSSSSIEIPIEILSDTPARATVFGNFSSYGLVAVGAMILGGAAVTYVVVTGRQPLGGRLGVGKKKRSTPGAQVEKKAEDASLKPEAKTLKSSIPSAGNLLHINMPHLPEPTAWLRKQTTGKDARALAHLVRLDEHGKVVSGSQIPIFHQEITIGSDSHRADIFIDDPGVDKNHATLYYKKKGKYTLLDQGSTAGTWVNYELAVHPGVELVHGDLICLGKCSFRFEEKNPTRIRQLLVTTQEGK